jgi:dihydropteroate synthase
VGNLRGLRPELRSAADSAATVTDIDELMVILRAHELTHKRRALEAHEAAPPLSGAQVAFVTAAQSTTACH